MNRTVKLMEALEQILHRVCLPETPPADETAGWGERLLRGFAGDDELAEDSFVGDDAWLALLAFGVAV